MPIPRPAIQFQFVFATVNVDVLRNYAIAGFQARDPVQIFSASTEHGRKIQHPSPGSRYVVLRVPVASENL